MSGKLDPSTGLTCVSCRVVFADGDMQKEHYRTDWHRYNLRRKVADLPPVTADQFQQKVISYRDKASKEETTASRHSFCGACNKQFQSTNAYDNHLNSKRHKENEAKLPPTAHQKFGAESSFCVYLQTYVDATTYLKKGVRIDLKSMRDCRKFTEIFKVGTTAKVSRMHHQTKQLVKQRDVMVDKIDSVMESEEERDDHIEGWFTEHATDDEEQYDESKAIPVTWCLFCSFPSANMELNLMHMSRLHGFFLPDAEFCVNVEGMLHYLGLKVGSGNMCLLCNERSKRFRSLGACQKHMRDKAHCRLAHEGDAMLEFEEFYDYSSLYVDVEDAEEANDFLIGDGFSLVLPSGVRIGHRSLMRYYRQHLKPIETEKMKSKEAIKKVVGHYKAIGWTGTTGELAVQRAKDIRFMRRLSSEQWLKLGITSNKLFKSRGRSDQ